MSKKITLLTFHFNQNYGAVIQAFALQKFLEARGYDVAFPSYVPPYMRPSSALFRGLKSNGRVRLGLVVQKLRSIPRRIKFHQFRKQHLRINRHADTLEKSLEVQKQSGSVIVGSDQVWNLNWQPGESFDGYYFMEMLEGFPVKKISYAACFGKKEQPEEKLGLAGKLIANLDAVFSRNKLTQSVAQQVAGISVPLVVDPTMLPDVQWPIRNTTSRHGRFILAYSIDENQTAMAEAIISLLKGNEALRVIQVCSENAHLVRGCDQYETSSSPGEWLDLIHNAEYVVTDSFHGCVFALKFGRKLVAYAEDWRAERIQDLLESVGLARCLFTQLPHLERLSESSFFEVDRALIRAQLEAAGKASADLLTATMHG